MSNFLESIGAFIVSIGIIIGGFFGYVPNETQVDDNLGRAVNPVAGKTYTIRGAGISSSATQIPLTSFTAPVTGAPFNMSHFGNTASATGYVTIEPGNSVRQEIVSFTGITQNPDGTALLTGVTRGLLPFPPYTASSTYAISHSGGAQVVVSNPPQLYEAIYSYIDNATTSGAVDAATTIKGLVEVATGVEAASSTQIGGGNTTAPLALTTLISTSTPGRANVIPVSRADGTVNKEFLGTGLYLSRQYTYTSTSTYTIATGTQYVRVEMWGGGGSGARRNGGDATGGGGGQYLSFTVASTSLASSTVIIIGGGGRSITGSDADGDNGRNTYFGTTSVAYGGQGGFGPGASIGAWGGSIFGHGSTTQPRGIEYVAFCATVGCGSVNSGVKASSTVEAGSGSGRGAGPGDSGDSIYGGAAGASITTAGVAGNAGDSMYGGDGGAASNGGTATNGVAPGGGGGSCVNVCTSGEGAPGRVVITEYY